MVEVPTRDVSGVRTAPPPSLRRDGCLPPDERGASEERALRLAGGLSDLRAAPRSGRDLALDRGWSRRPFDPPELGSCRRQRKGHRGP